MFAVPLVAAAVIIGGTVYYVLTREDEPEPLALPGVGTTELPPSTEPKEPAKPEVDPNSPTITPAEIVGTYESGKIHKTQSGDSISGLSRRVLNSLVPGSGDDPTLVRAVKRALNSSAWNRELYGVADDSVMDAVDGMHVEKAFLPRHERGWAVVSAGFFPERQIDASGGKLPGSPGKWGSLYVPLLSAQAIAAGITDLDALVMNHPDGSPGLEPPASAQEQLRIRA